MIAGAGRRYDLRGADAAITPRAWTAKCCGISTCRSTASPIWRGGERIVEAVRAPEGEVRIAVVGKYTNLLDSYKSLAEALAHGGIANRVKVQLDWVDSEIFEQPDAVHRLEGVHGILVPGGFGERGTPGKIEAVRFARETQRAVLRHLLRHADGGDRGGAEPGRPARCASSTEFGPCDDAGGRPAHRMGARQRDRAAHGRRRSRRHDAAGRVSGGAERRAALVRRSMAARRGSRSGTAIATR